MALKDYYDRINHVGVPTEDMAATVRFYTDLGFTLIYKTKNGDQQVCFLENGSIQIEAYTVEHAANARGAIDHLALNCTDIEAAFEEAKKNTKTPTLIEFVINPEELVYPMVQPGGTLEDLIMDC